MLYFINNVDFHQAFKSVVENSMILSDYFKPMFCPPTIAKTKQKADFG